MSLRCHFDQDGWLQGPPGTTITHHMTPNHFASGFATRARGMVQHTEDGFEAGTVATFMDSKAQVSAFFGVSEAGAIDQFLPVGRGLVAWAEADGNQEWYSCECEDRLNPGQPMPPAQITAFAQVLEACAARDGFPLESTDDVNGTGLICHGDGGVAWGNHPDCPGSVRKAQRPAILEKARAIRAEGATAAAAPPRQWKTAGIDSLAQLAAAQKTEPSTILRLTAEHSAGAVFSGDVSTWLNAVFTGTADPRRPVPAGLTLWLPGA